MAINETILGPNSSALVISGTAETPTTMMAAVDAYITAHGWEVHDANATTAPQIGRVYRTRQQGSTTTYKYVLVAFSSSSYTITPYEVWNATTHVGTNPITSLNVSVSSGNNLNVVNSQSFNYADGASIIMFVNPKWLAARFRNNVLVYDHMIGSFEIAKDFGEADSVSSNILLSTSVRSSYPYNTYAGFYGSCISNGNSASPTGVATQNANIVTAIGMPVNGMSLDRLLTGVVTNSALTMTAVETGNGSTYGVSRFRGRIYGAKLIAGNTVWNDMDTAQLVVDSEFHQEASGTAMTHHIVAISTTFVRFLIPA